MLVQRYSYFILVCVVASNYVTLWWQQRGLSYFPSVYVVPINQVFLIVIGTILGGVYFREFEGMPKGDAIMFIVAILMTSVGVIALAVGHTLFKDIQLELPLAMNEDETYKDIDRQHQLNSSIPQMQRTHSRSLSSSESRSRSSSNNSDYLATAATGISVEIPKHSFGGAQVHES